MNVLLVILLIYLLGYAVSFLWLFFGFDDHKVKYLKADAMFSLCSWVIVILLILCYGLIFVDEADEKDNDV